MNDSTNTLASVMKAHPTLNTFGMGAFDPDRKTPAQRAAEVAAGRVELLEREQVVLEVARWLRENITSAQPPGVGSYTMKHTYERATDTYITNGELIAAALLVGYPAKHRGGANVEFGMSKRDVGRFQP